MTDPLATPTELSTLLKVDPYTGTELAQVTDLLDKASAEIRAAIGQYITRVDDETIELPVYSRELLLDLPELPVVSVSAALIDGTAVADYKPVGSKLYRRYGWLSDAGCGYEPSVVTVTYTHGMTEIPEELNTLCLALAAAGKAQIADGSGTLGPIPGVVSEAIDDYRVQNAGGEDAVPHVMTLPEATIERLRARYGTGVALVSMG